jgi:hypothetical protein
MGILDKHFRDCICLRIGDRIDSMQMLEEIVMRKRAKSLERRIR